LKAFQPDFNRLSITTDGRPVTVCSTFSTINQITTMTKDIHSAAQALGRLGGLAKSKAKAEAVRENGKLGGRPLGKEDTKPRKQRIK
jgi:hypothetical protein